MGIEMVGGQQGIQMFQQHGFVAREAGFQRDHV
jgi:hypothetical protein